ncbi:hypothetical protein EMIHUDRAFT_97942 [Emiliania huxleyi CCMP1516]|uniref:Kinesin motor domain-containing protein n=3 Tax=Emiliania huxleyi TaxID=2903 RepID=A0A0D3KQL0_EMIH1|nr:hypothetical protein EMIHUDRAFT_97942 [Emiliania huxleyi CCMP1516]EOD38045.1 hypothetical protein EMIHUDRAFT_97942 [Emiliania huxleyi CCMP1516]|eukprot:XP_005790474.1 hypothetical protein EMIHUDRAFT_97942 [Emiliania huxleyi CCMP1516]
MATACRKPKLHKPDIYVRIRPLAAEGGHAEDGTVLQKHLEAWDEASVTVGTQHLFSKGEARYAYPRRVFGTEATQREVTDEIVPGLVESFTAESTSVLFFAYGQTGTGKTRTMLGTEASLRSAEPHEEWGVFPRVCTAAFDKLAALRARGVKCRLSGSAIEFYLGECFDLLSSSRAGNSPVQIEAQSHMPAGESCVPLERPADLAPFFEKVIANRTARSTNFNHASAEHSGSSRSHAALTLTLATLDEASRDYCQTTFTLVDLAGAERPDKVKADVKGGRTDLAPEFLPSLLHARDAGKLSQQEVEQAIPIGFQTKMINFELFSLCSEVLKASECHRKGRPFKLTPMSTPTIKFLSAILDGRARLAMCVTLSPAGRNAWETWFSLQYGADLAKLHAPRIRQKAVHFDKLRKAVAKEAAELQDAVDGMAESHRYYAQKRHRASHAAEQLRRLDALQSGSCREPESR